MVALSPKAPAILTLDDPATGVRLRRFTVEEYDRLIDSGYLPTTSALELIDGLIVHKDRGSPGEAPMAVGSRHMMAVRRLGNALAPVESWGMFALTQAPMVIAPASEPEPDALIVKGADRDYWNRKPTPADVLCVFEVADSSLDFDRTQKLRLYQHARIRQYVLINLVDHVLEQYVLKNRRLERVATAPPGQSIDLKLGRQTLRLDPSQILPAR